MEGGVHTLSIEKFQNFSVSVGANERKAAAPGCAMSYSTAPTFGAYGRRHLASRSGNPIFLAYRVGRP